MKTATAPKLSSTTTTPMTTSKAGTMSAASRTPMPLAVAPKIVSATSNLEG